MRVSPSFSDVKSHVCTGESESPTREEHSCHSCHTSCDSLHDQSESPAREEHSCHSCHTSCDSLHGQSESPAMEEHCTMIERLVWDYGLVHEVAESTALVIGLSLGQSQSAPIRDQVM